MKLKKNDKIILIVGVVILIAAGAGIALYTVDDSADSTVSEDEDIIYSYSWMKKTGEVTIYSGEFVGKNTPFEGSFSLTSPKNTVLTRIDLELSWEDDGRYGLLSKNKGLDTLDAEISQNGEVETINSYGEGNETVTFTINDMPLGDQVQAPSMADAMDQIANEIAGDNSASFDMTVTISTGERIWRLLKYLRDTGDDFDLTASYTYYMYEFDTTEPSDNDDEDEDNKDMGDDGGFGHNIGEFYINLGYGRGMI